MVGKCNSFVIVPRRFPNCDNECFFDILRDGRALPSLANSTNFYKHRDLILNAGVSSDGEYYCV